MGITQEKGDLAVAKVITDLTQKGYVMFSPTICESLPFDLISYKDGIIKRLQVKYVTNDYIRGRINGKDPKYKINDFDYFAVFYPKLEMIIYPSIKFAGCKIASKLRNSATPFYWYEDFLDFTDQAEKKIYKDFGYKITCAGKGEFRTEYRKVQWPTKEELHKLLWEKPTVQIAKDFGVSDKAVEKWTKSYGLEKPARGYWAKKKANPI